eukprot:TRINITY_DN61795_c0_g1_i1.p1 TRINITY_DN61795_c0_g1~~TRINITY_DN61795_c0_g1_i1.p1  ORF type:complete len:104 (+),score=22.70 TRINITY_DN61795_c0_g1_i1:37-312(+)
MSAPSAPSHLTQAQERAQGYVDKHGLDRLVTAMMNSVIKDQPEEPKSFMIKWLADRCSEKQLDLTGLTWSGSGGGRAAEVEAARQFLEKRK